MDKPDLDPNYPLSQPSTARVFALIDSEKRRLSTAEVAGLADLHLNSTRLHLARLREAVSPASELTGFNIRDPDKAGCLIEIEAPANLAPTK